VALNARDAADRGATIRTRTKVVDANRTRITGRVTIEDSAAVQRETVKARLLVNAAGPWVDHVLSDAIHKGETHNVRLVQGSHIVVPKKFDDPRAYFFQNRDGRIIFAIPYEDDFTLIGTTDQDYQGELGQGEDQRRRDRLSVRAASEYFLEPVTRDDIVWTYSAVRRSMTMARRRRRKRRATMC
jgi:glycerol-3-phosphate dehydrogenase